MNPRKRQAPDTPSTRRNKQPRLALKGYNGDKPSPSENEGLLSRWNRFRMDFIALSTDTLAVIFSSLWFIAHRPQFSSTYRLFQKRHYSSQAIRENQSSQIPRPPRPLNEFLHRPEASYLTHPQTRIIPNYLQTSHRRVVIPPHHGNDRWYDRLPPGPTVPFRQISTDAYEIFLKHHQIQFLLAKPDPMTKRLL